MRSSTWHPSSGDAHARGRVFTLWTGLLSGPIVFLILLQYQYTLAYVACETKQTWFLHLATLVAVALVAAGGFSAWRAGYSPRHVTDEASEPVSGATCENRTRWMAMFALISSAWFIIVILAMEVPIAVLKVCQ